MEKEVASEINGVENMSPDFKTAEKLSERLVADKDLTNLFNQWMMKEAKLSPQQFKEVSENLKWLLKSYDPKDLDKIKGAVNDYLAGVGAGKVGLLTLNSVIKDLKADNKANIDGATLAKYMVTSKSSNGEEKDRMVEGAKKSFSVKKGIEYAKAHPDGKTAAVGSAFGGVTNASVQTMTPSAYLTPNYGEESRKEELTKLKQQLGENNLPGISVDVDKGTITIDLPSPRKAGVYQLDVKDDQALEVKQVSAVPNFGSSYELNLYSKTGGKLIGSANLIVNNEGANIEVPADNKINFISLKDGKQETPADVEKNVEEPRTETRKRFNRPEEEQ